MAVLINNESLVPFFSKPMLFIKGLDPLGLQNTSESTYTLLLPGLNNVTGRVRYYSFYCWLLQEYAKRIGSTNPSEQRKFIRRAELIVALVNRSNEDEVGGIPGSLYANRELKKDLKTHDLEKGTYNEDGSTTKTYWQYPSGAFGQYYIGSLVDIGLIAEREKHASVFVRTPARDGIKVSGEQLAHAFDQNITPKNKTLFFKCIKLGEVETRDLDLLLKDFNLSEIPNNTKEKELLVHLIIEKDYPQLLEETPQIFRKKTIHHLLRFVNNTTELTDRSFTTSAYFAKGIDTVEDDCLIGWYYYQLNEFWQYANLGILNGVLDCLENKSGSGWKGLYSLINEVSSETLKILIRDEIIPNKQQPLNVVIDEIEHWVDEIHLFQLINDESGAERIAYSFMLIFSLYRKNLLHLERLKQFGVNYGVEKDGDSISYFLKFERFFKISIEQFIKEFLLTNIIYRHQYVAFRKMGGGIRSTQLFLIEDGYIRRMKNFAPTLTSPRINRLIRFLSDLHVLENNSLSKMGKYLLTTI